MITWRVARVNVTHAFTLRAYHSLCGLVRRADTVLSWRGEPGTETCFECERLARQEGPQHVV